MAYLPTFTINLSQREVNNIPYMDPMGYIYIIIIHIHENHTFFSDPFVLRPRLPRHDRPLRLKKSHGSTSRSFFRGET